MDDCIKTKQVIGNELVTPERSETVSLRGLGSFALPKIKLKDFILQVMRRL